MRLVNLFMDFFVMDFFVKAPSLLNLSHISYNDETWHSYTLPKEDPKNL